MKIHKNSLFYHIFALTLSNIGLMILGFIYRIFLSRMTGAEGMGVYQLVFPFYSVVLAICVTGLIMAVSRLSAQYEAFHDLKTARRVVQISLIIFFMLFICVATPTILFSDWIAGTVLGDSRTRISLLIILPCLLGTGIENILKNYFFGTCNLKYPIASELTEQTVRIIAVAVLLITYHPEDAGTASALIVCGMVISEISSVIILNIFYRNHKKKVPSNTHKQVGTLHLLREITAIAVPIALAALINNLLSSANSILIPQRLVAAGMEKSDAISAFGVLFGMTMPLLSLPIALIGAITVVMVSKLSEGVAVGLMRDVRRKAGKTIHVTGLLSFPAIAVLIPLGQCACQLLYHQDSAGSYMLPLCIGTLFSYYQISLTALLNAIGQQRRAAIIIVIGGVLQLIGTWLVGIPSIGIYGFLAGYIVSSILMSALDLLCLIRRLKLQIQWNNWVITPLLASILAGLCANLLLQIAQNDGLGSWVSLLLSLSGSCLVYLLTLRVQGTSGIHYIKTLIPSKR